MQNLDSIILDKGYLQESALIDMRDMNHNLITVPLYII